MLERAAHRYNELGRGFAARLLKAIINEYGDIPHGEASFSTEQKNELTRRGYKIFTLSGYTFEALRDNGYPFSCLLREGETIEQSWSTRTEQTDVAIDPEKFFLPDSNQMTKDQQLEILRQFGERIGGEVKGVTAILGSVPDYVELEFLHQGRTDQKLFGSMMGNNNNFTRTIDHIGNSKGAIIGCGMRVYSFPLDERQFNIWAAPLVVPAAAVWC